MENEGLLGAIALVLVAVAGSTMGIYARALAVDLNIFEQVALRSFIGALLLYLFMWRQVDFTKLASAPVRDLVLLVCRALSIYGFAICLGTIAFVYGKYTSAAIVMSLPVPAIMSLALFHERIGARNAVLVAIAFCGVVLTIWAGSDEAAEIDWPLLAALGSAVFMSFGILSQRLQTGHFNLMETTFFMLCIASVVIACIAVGGWVAGGAVPHLSAWQFGVATAAGATSMVFMLLSNYGVPRVSGVVVNNTLALQPVFAAGIGALLYADRIGLLEAFGAVMILTSVIFLKR